MKKDLININDTYAIAKNGGVGVTDDNADLSCCPNSYCFINTAMNKKSTDTDETYYTGIC